MLIRGTELSCRDIQISQTRVFLQQNPQWSGMDQNVELDQTKSLILKGIIPGTFCKRMPQDRLSPWEPHQWGSLLWIESLYLRQMLSASARGTWSCLG